jgi:hypothetical protein
MKLKKLEFIWDDKNQRSVCKTIYGKYTIDSSAVRENKFDLTYPIFDGIGDDFEIELDFNSINSAIYFANKKHEEVISLFYESK